MDDELAQIRTALADAHARIEELTESYEATVLETEPAVGSWSPRDVVGHLADWELETLDAAEHILGGPKPRFQPIKDRPGYNTMRAALRGADSWNLTAQDLVASRDRALALLDELSPAQLGAIGPYPSGEIGPLRKLLQRHIQHLQEHAAQLDEWRLRRTGMRLEFEQRERPRDGGTTR